MPLFAAVSLYSNCNHYSYSLQSLDYPPVGAITLAYPESALRPDRLDANGNLPGGLHVLG